ncbi:hypothetical protein [Streptomyces sp. NPDC047000]|uniref:hypothetical protein n=1 Tax=Streptomyces sp. NPDC047000 TaxID=3155474 RepID=UPI0033CF3C0D
MWTPPPDASRPVRTGRGLRGVCDSCGSPPWCSWLSGREHPRRAKYHEDEHIKAISGKNSVSGAVAAADEKWETRQYLDASRRIRAAVVARLQELNADGEISKTDLRRFVTITVAWDEKKRKMCWAALKAATNGDAGVCSEDHCDEETVSNGSAKEDLQYAETHGARNDREISICTRCQESRELEQFEASGADLRESGRLWLQQQAESGAEAQEEAMTAAEEEAEVLAQGLAQALED